MFLTLNGFGDLLIFVVVVAFVLIITKDDNSKDDGSHWDQWRTHK
jgi:hypothetical protein